MCISRKSYQASSRKIVRSQELQKPVILALLKEVLGEMRSISSSSNFTLLRGSNENLENFSWGAMFEEMQGKLPILLSFLQHILPKADTKLLVFLVAMMLKRHCKHL